MPKVLGNLIKDNWGTGFAYNVFDKHDLAPTIRTFCGGGQQPYIVEENMKTLDIGISPAIMTSNNDKIVRKDYEEKMNEEHKINRVGQISNESSQYDSVLSEKGLSATLSAGTHGYSNNCIQQKYRIRKLTPMECFRLMNFDDTDFYAAESVNSNTRLYSQAGNSIVVGCLAAIFSQLNIKNVTPWNDMTIEQKYEITKIDKCDNPGYQRNIL